MDSRATRDPEFGGPASLAGAPTILRSASPGPSVECDNQPPSVARFPDVELHARGPVRKLPKSKCHARGVVVRTPNHEVAWRAIQRFQILSIPSPQAHREIVPPCRVSYNTFVYGEDHRPSALLRLEVWLRQNPKACRHEKLMPQGVSVCVAHRSPEVCCRDWPVEIDPGVRGDTLTDRNTGNEPFHTAGFALTGTSPSWIRPACPTSIRTSVELAYNR